MELVGQLVGFRLVGHERFADLKFVLSEILLQNSRNNALGSNRLAVLDHIQHSWSIKNDFVDLNPRVLGLLFLLFFFVSVFVHGE